MNALVFLSGLPILIRGTSGQLTITYIFTFVNEYFGIFDASFLRFGLRLWMNALVFLSGHDYLDNSQSWIIVVGEKIVDTFDGIPKQNLISSNQSLFFINIATYLKDFTQKLIEKVDFRKPLVPITMNI